MRRIVCARAKRKRRRDEDTADLSFFLMMNKRMRIPNLVIDSGSGLKWQKQIPVLANTEKGRKKTPNRWDEHRGKARRVLPAVKHRGCVLAHIPGTFSTPLRRLGTQKSQNWSWLCTIPPWSAYRVDLRSTSLAWLDTSAQRETDTHGPGSPAINKNPFWRCSSLIA